MKILGISLMILVSLMGMSFTIDIFLGFDLKTSIRNAMSPFKVMEFVEFMIFLLFVIILLGKSLVGFFKKKKLLQPK
ncbi:hypothetical protein J7E71_23120 [Mesobacillus foraminis]|uniref:hypothetical protein n=1 Tax=Mesobacillus foraminis TaxID=279826 RepID=UPI001BECB3FD|nr:hypothetical protein [Mesobacillus foraminis]MBT2758768.1 hypothetical protein [Mesobacillus foraminis]